LEERHTGEHCGVEKYFGTTKIFRKSGFEGYGDSLKTLHSEKKIKIHTYLNPFFFSYVNAKFHTRV
jgi:hypothetical protein